MGDTLVPWVTYLHRALAYDCEVTIRLAVPVTSLMNPSVILDWPIKFLDKFGRPIYASHQAWITASLLDLVKVSLLSSYIGDNGSPWLLEMKSSA